MKAPSDVSFRITTIWLMRAGSMMRKAWGSRIKRSVAALVNPMAAAASV